MQAINGETAVAPVVYEHRCDPVIMSANELPKYLDKISAEGKGWEFVSAFPLLMQRSTMIPPEPGIVAIFRRPKASAIVKG